VRPLVEHVKRFHGKMLRPAMTVLAGRCFGDIGRTHHQLGAVVELIHTATLVHDDVLDDSDMRRGIGTVNREWGNHTAILLGDFLFATAFSLSANIENRLASRYLSWITGVVCQGEMLQILETGNLDLAEEVYIEVIEKKTAFLFSAAARVGAEYQGASQEAVDALTGYGMKLGTAFQVIDDCLDLDGDQTRVGKTLGTDARQGKVTLPVIHFLESATREKGDRMRDLLSSGDHGARDEIRDLLDREGSLEYARGRATAYAEDAARLLEVVPPSDYRDVLLNLARYTLSRKR
jgi:octaprenyl-diphosphate synthase